MLAFVFFIAADLVPLRAVPLEPVTPSRALAAALRQRALTIADIERDVNETLRLYTPPLRRFVDFVWTEERVMRAVDPCGRGDLIVWQIRAAAVRGRGLNGGEVVGEMPPGLWSTGGLPTLILWQDAKTGKLDDATLVEGEPFKDVLGLAESPGRQCPDLVVRRSGIVRLSFDNARGYYDDARRASAE